MVDLGKYKQKSQPKISFWANQLKCVTAKHFRHNYLSACENKYYYYVKYLEFCVFAQQ